MTAQRGSKRKKSVANEELKLDSKTRLGPAKLKEKARIRSDKPLTKTQKVLRPTHVEAKHESQARNKSRKKRVAARLKAEQEYPAQISRVSFVVRLTLGKNGQFGRTEIEHVASGKKQGFLSLDGEALVTFMKGSISPAIVPESVVLPALPLNKVQTPMPMPLRSRSNVIVSDIQLFSSDPISMNLTIVPEKPFFIRVRFQLQDLEIPSPTAQQFLFEVKIYAKEVTTGKSKALTVYTSELIQDVLHYEVPVEVPGLSPGFYRLVTLITTSTPIKLAGYHDGPIVQVI